jgi:hypothetical protein
MKAYSREFYEAQEMFEKIARGMRFDKPTAEEREHIPAKYGWYNDGKTNDMFNIFLHGIEFGSKINQ